MHAPCYLQELRVDGFGAHPAATDAATHLGALCDTDAGGAAKVPVGLGAYCVPYPGQARRFKSLHCNCLFKQCCFQQCDKHRWLSMQHLLLSGQNNRICDCAPLNGCHWHMHGNRPLQCDPVA